MRKTRNGRSCPRRRTTSHHSSSLPERRKTAAAESVTKGIRKSPMASFSTMRMVPSASPQTVFFQLRTQLASCIVGCPMNVFGRHSSRSHSAGNSGQFFSIFSNFDRQWRFFSRSPLRLRAWGCAPFTRSKPVGLLPSAFRFWFMFF